MEWNDIAPSKPGRYVMRYDSGEQFELTLDASLHADCLRYNPSDTSAEWPIGVPFDVVMGKVADGIQWLTL